MNLSYHFLITVVCVCVCCACAHAHTLFSSGLCSSGTFHFHFDVIPLAKKTKKNCGKIPTKSFRLKRYINNGIANENCCEASAIGCLSILWVCMLFSVLLLYHMIKIPLLFSFLPSFYIDFDGRWWWNVCDRSEFRVKTNPMKWILTQIRMRKHKMICPKGKDENKLLWKF